MRKNGLYFSLVILLFVFPCYAHASPSNNPSLSDAVFADLALKGYIDNVSVSYYDRINSDAININETRHWLPASTVKVFAAMYAYKKISDKSLRLSDSFTADPKNIVPTELVTDELPSIEAGDSVTLDRLVQQMITQSDNTSFNMLIDILGRKAITDYIHSLGLTHSSVGSKLNLDTSQEQYEYDDPGFGINTTTADDYSKAFILIWDNKIPGSEKLITILKKQKINYMIPLFLPKDIPIAHKHGDLDPLYHDGGIIFGQGKAYVLSIFSNVGNPNIIAHISDLIYTQNFSLVGESQDNINNYKKTEPLPALDPLLSEGNLPQSNVLGESNLPVQTQPITAADLGITAKDLSLAKPTSELPKVSIPADSPWHFLKSIQYFSEKAVVFGPRAQAKVDLKHTLLQVSEAKELTLKGKLTQAHIVLNEVQQKLNTIAREPITKNDADIQTMIQSVSETRFQSLGEVLRGVPGDNRNELIHEIGQQAKNSFNQLQPNLPLAVNATNPTQRPLLGQVIDKTETSIIVKTAGNQLITIPLVGQDVTVKTKQVVSPPLPTTTPNITESLSVSPTESVLQNISVTPKISPLPEEKATLNTVALGTTVALVGSAVGNTFTPTFVLTNVPKELAAPVPVTVVKVNPKNNTMVISENGNPVQVNVSNQTIVKGNDTRISFNDVKSGDVVVVHGVPLVPIITVTPSPIPTLPPNINPSFLPPKITRQSSDNTNSNVTLTPSTIKNPVQSSITPQTTNLPFTGVGLLSPTPQSKISQPVLTTVPNINSKNQNGIIPITQTIINQQNQPVPSLGKNINSTKTGNNSVTLPSNPAQNKVIQNQPVQSFPNTTSNSNKSPQTPSSSVQSVPPQPKVIQSTTIQVIEKKEDVQKITAPASQSNNPPAPQKASNPPEQHNNSQPAQHSDNPPPAQPVKHSDNPPAANPPANVPASSTGNNKKTK